MYLRRLPFFGRRRGNTIVSRPLNALAEIHFGGFDSAVGVHAGGLVIGDRQAKHEKHDRSVPCLTPQTRKKRSNTSGDRSRRPGLPLVRSRRIARCLCDGDHGWAKLRFSQVRSGRALSLLAGLTYCFMRFTDRAKFQVFSGSRLPQTTSFNRFERGQTITFDNMRSGVFRRNSRARSQLFSTCDRGCVLAKHGPVSAIGVPLPGAAARDAGPAMSGRFARCRYARPPASSVDTRARLASDTGRRRAGGGMSKRRTCTECTARH